MRSKLRAALAASGRAIALVAIFAAALVAALILHANVPAARRVVAASLGRALTARLEGTFEVERIGALKLDGLRGARVRVTDPDGAEVLLADGVEIVVDARSGLRSAVGSGELSIDLLLVSIDHASVSVDADASGGLRLARAFHARARRPAPREQASRASRGIALDGRRIALRHAWIHGAPTRSAAVDLELKDVLGRARHDARGAEATIERLDLTARMSPAGLAPRGRVHGGVAHPRGGVLRGDAFFDGTVGAAEVTALASVEDARLAVEARARLGHAIARVDARLRLHARESFEGDATIAVRHLDMAALDGRVPTSDLALDVRADFDDRNATVTLRAEAPALALAALAGLPSSSSGRAVLEANAQLERGTLRADLDARVNDARVGGLEVGDVHARGHVERRDGALEIRDAHVRVARGPARPLEAEGRVEIGPDRVELSQVRVDGLGETVRGSFLRTRDDGRVRLDARRIDLTRVAHLVGVPHVRSGSLAVALDLAWHHGGASGELHARLADLAQDALPPLSAAVDVSLRGAGLDADGVVDVGPGGRVAVRARGLRAGGDLLELSSWRRAVGALDVTSTIDLVHAQRLFAGKLPSGVVLAGGAEASLRLRRDDASVLPTAWARIRTVGLEVRGGARAVTAPPRWRTAGIDLVVEASVDGRSGDAQMFAQATDARGLLAAADAKARVPRTMRLADLLTMPVNAKLLVPSRAVAELPASFGLGAAEGTVEATGDLTGTPLDPRLELVAHARRVRLGEDLETAVDVALSYDGALATLTADARRGEQATLDLRSRIELRASDLLRAPRGPLPWRASGRAMLDHLPLEWLARLEARGVRGALTGEIVLEDLHEDARLSGRVAAEDLTVGGARVRLAQGTLALGRGRLDATARVEQDDGYADVRVRSSATWGSSVLPRVDRATLEADLRASALRAAIFAPFVARVASALDGRLDGAVSLRGPAATGAATMNGRIELTGGQAQLASLGLRLTEIHAVAAFRPDGKVVIERFTARGAGGELEGTASVELRGLAFAGATGALRVEPDRPMDLVAGGRRLGKISGEVSLRASPTSLLLDVAQVTLELSASISTRAQRLGRRREDVHVGVYRDGTDDFLPVAIDGSDAERRRPEARRSAERPPSAIAIHLGAAHVRRGTMVDLLVSGDPTITLGSDGARVTGALRVEGGWIDVRGKRFEAETGRIDFRGESPLDPDVVARARWVAPDGMRVYAGFRGPASTGRLVLQSTPPLPEEALLRLVLLDGDSSASIRAETQRGRDASVPEAARIAAEVGTALAARGVNDVLDAVAPFQASARLDTSRASGPRPEVRVDVSRRVSFVFSRTLGATPVSEPDRNVGTIAWRLRRGWIVEASLGDRGRAALDAVWQHDY